MEKQVKRNIHTFKSSKEVIREEDYDILSISNSTMEDSDESSSDFSSDYGEDVSSSSSTSSSTDGPLFQLSNLMDQLPPIKRGLSKYYQGKSQSFAKLGIVENLEDLVKRENPYQKRMKLCKSFCERLTSPKATISKKASYPSRMRRKCSNNFMPTCGLPPISIHKD